VAAAAAAAAAATVYMYDGYAIIRGSGISLCAGGLVFQLFQFFLFV
jgi:hypothetical protein